MALLQTENCVSCGVGLVSKGSTTLPCPRCGHALGRCGGCREQAVHYTCPNCQFQGP